MNRLKSAFIGLWVAHASFRMAVVLAAFVAPWLLFALSSPAGTVIGVVIDLAALSLVGSTIVYAAWHGFDAVGAKLRGVVTVAALLNLAAAEFAFAYWSVAQRDVGAFTEPLDRASAAYLSVGTFTTVEVGDLAPLSSGARMVATAQMAFGVAAMVVGLASVVGATTRRQRA